MDPADHAAADVHGVREARGLEHGEDFRTADTRLAVQDDPLVLREVLEGNLEGSLHGRDFFIRKALGWALREHARTDPDWVRAFVAAHEDRLSGLTRREALKHLA